MHVEGGSMHVVYYINSCLIKSRIARHACLGRHIAKSMKKHLGHILGRNTQTGLIFKENKVVYISMVGGG